MPDRTQGFARRPKDLGVGGDVEQFDTIHSDFVRLVDTDRLGGIEWRSVGRLRAGADITCRRVSIRDFDEVGRVRRFATSDDTPRFHASPLLGQEG